MPRQGFRTVDLLRLEVESDPTGLRNLVKNPSGDLGAWGWVTPAQGNVLSTEGGATPQFVFSTTTNVLLSIIGTEMAPAAVGQWCNARVMFTSRSTTSETCRLRFEQFDSDLNLIATSIGPSWAGESGPFYGIAIQLSRPNVAFVRLRIEARTDNKSFLTAGRMIKFREAMLTTGPTQESVAPGFAYAAPVAYVNVLGPALNIKLGRDELDVSTLSAEILDSTLDPSQSTLIRPGKAVRLLAYDGAAWQTLFTGTVRTGSATYDLKQPKANRRVKVQINASDNATALANSQRPQGVGTIAELPFVLEGAGIPWNVNGSGNQVPTAAVVATNQNATALDQIAITRDSQGGYAWVDRLGVVNVWNRSLISSAVKRTLADADYSDLDVTFDQADVINEVNVKLLRPNLATGQTVEVPYGPYRDATSISTYGAYSAAFTVQGLPDDNDNMRAFASTVLQARATPMVRVNTLRLPIVSAADVVSKGLLDLYDLVRVVNTGTPAAGTPTAPTAPPATPALSNTTPPVVT